MITLEKISTIWLKKYLETDGLYNKKESVFLKALRDYNVVNYGQLKELMSKRITPFNDMEFHIIINEIEKRIKKLNNSSKEAPLYEFDSYQNSGFNEDILNQTDKFVIGENLIIHNPLIPHSTFCLELNEISIYTMKSLLGLYSIERVPTGLDNAFTNSIKNFGVERTRLVVESIRFYEEQIIRQANLYPDDGRNLFFIDFVEKMQMVDEQLDEIINYLVNNDHFVWGSISPQQRKYLLECNIRKMEKLRLVREKLIRMICNYVTIEETKSGLVKTRTLDRFILK